MHLPDINPIIIHLWIFSIRWYALAYVAGIVAGWYYINQMLKREALWAPRQPPMQVAQLDDLILWVTGGVILGGRIGYILAYDTSIIWQHPLQMLKIWEGGMSFHGGFTGVVIATLLYCRSQQFSAQRMLSLGDLLASAAPIGLFFGRIANFINGELWGRETDLPWGMVFCNKYIREQYNGVCPADPLDLGITRHPSQLYEALGEGLIMFIVLFILGQRMGELKKPGLVMGTFIAGYGVIRILLENVRNPDAQMLPFFKIITMGMILSVPMVLAGGFFIWQATRPKAASPALPDKTDAAV